MTRTINHISTLKATRILMVLMAFMFFFDLSSQSSVTPPDFAYPKTVEKNSLLMLRKAEKEKNDVEILRALINLELAKTSIDNNTVDKSLEEIRTAAQKMTTPQGRAMAKLLEANILSAVYSSNSFIYEARKIPETEYSDTCTLWSGDQFRNRIISLCQDVTANFEDLRATPLSDYSLVIDITQSARPYFPTLMDFAAWNILKMLKSFVINDYYSINPLAKSSSSEAYVPSANTPLSKLIFEVAENVLTHHKDDYAPQIIFTLEFESMMDSDRSERFENQNKIYKLFEGKSEFSGLILERMSGYMPAITTNYSSVATLRNYCDLINKFIAHYPTYEGNKNLKAIIKRINIPSCNLRLREYATPGYDFTFSAQILNRNKVKIEIYNVTSFYNPQKQNISAKDLSSHAPIKTIEFELDSLTPFACDTTLSVIFDEPGYYVIRPTGNQNTDKANNQKRTYTPIRCTSLWISQIDTKNSFNSWVVNPMTGEPVEDAQIKLLPHKANIARDLAKTDSEGWASFLLASTEGGEITAVKGNDHFANSIYQYGSRKEKETIQHRAIILPDLPVYRPGDTIRFSSICYAIYPSSGDMPVHGGTMTVKLKDTNWKDIDSITATTDEFGRVNGRFAVPKDLLTGNFSLKAYIEGKEIGTTYIEVSDYKLPDFGVILNTPLITNASSREVALSGAVLTFSGFALASQEVRLKISTSFNDKLIGEFVVKTDSNGKFTYNIAPDILSQNVSYNVEASVTSPSGETQTSNTHLYINDKTYTIIIDADEENYNLSKGTPRISARIFDSQHNIVQKPLKLYLLKQDIDNDTVWIAKGEGTVKAVDWQNIPSGKYRLVAESDSLYSDKRNKLIVLYRPDDTKSYFDTPLWVPEDNSIIENGKIKTLYATNRPLSYILAIVVSEDSILSKRIINVGEGMHTFEQAIPPTYIDKTISLILATVSNYQIENLRVDYRPAHNSRQIKMHRESFRNHLLPGTEERWQFKFMRNDSTGVKAGVVMDLYNDAISRISPLYWNRFRLKDPTPYINILRNYNYSSIWVTQSSTIPNIRIPEYNTYWQLYGKSLYMDESDKYEICVPALGIARSSKNAMKAECTSDGIFEDVIVCAEDEYEEAEEAAVEGSNLDNGSSMSERNVAETEFSYREHEVVNGFFLPSLTTDSDGSLSVSFTVPNANTTWNFRSFAYTKDLASNYSEFEVITSKPLMVRANLPRFLRCGDTAMIEAMVMNATDSTISAVTQIDIFDPISNKIIDSKSFINDLTPGANCSIGTDVTAPSSGLLAYRVRSTADNFTDGEQAIIPLLDVTREVFKGESFYVLADSATTTVQLPELPDSATVTLEVCTNPVWTAVSALPSLIASKAETAQTITSQIFTAAVAQNLMKRYPLIAQAISQWQAQPDSTSMLTSLLEKNAELKQVLLAATPWQVASESDNERMARLASLFTTDASSSLLKRNIELLEKLQNKDGGLRWVNHFNESSEWATMKSLQLLGDLKLLGMYPENNSRLDNIVTKAIGYLDNRIAKRYAKNPKLYDISYLFTRQEFPSAKQSTAVKAVTASTINQILKSWKNYDIFNKSIVALILAKNGYRTMAGRVLESLSEFATVSPVKGMWWPNVENTQAYGYQDLRTTTLALLAYCALKPGAPETELINQWILLQNQTRNLGESTLTAQTITALLATSPKWIVKAGSLSAVIDGTPLQLTETDNYSGTFTTTLSGAALNRRSLTLAKESPTPAWGSICSKYTGAIDSISAESCDDLSVEKHYYIEKDGKWQSVSDFNVGDRIRIELLIRVGRTMEYVTIVDNRAACFEPIEQLPTPVYSEGIVFYRENRDASTNIFVTQLPKGNYRLSYDVVVNNSGEFASGIAEVQSQYAPQFAAHSGGERLKVNPKLD